MKRKIQNTVVFIVARADLEPLDKLCWAILGLPANKEKIMFERAKANERAIMHVTFLF